ncbi:hypothetical protein VTJ83DRAFT_917 [Remersonia thermophila]|uniref:General alpha-glucoside permease n=1 Tax=Remersonia thermophila TaxID=72144 RepID=A0ABR4DMI5_9PEZI
MPPLSADAPSQDQPGTNGAQARKNSTSKDSGQVAGREDEHDGADRAGYGQGPTSEHSPLLSPTSGEEEGLIEGQLPPGKPDEHQATKSLWYLILLTIGIGGLQIAWSVELSNGSPYLLSLGISKSLMALVWIAGPLSGTLVQPYVGLLSDKCRIPWGKRKPFMIGGTIATIASLMMLAWTKETVGGFLGLFGAQPDSEFVKVSVIVVAVLWVYILDFAINTVQAAIRAFIVDCAPTHQQESANAMASRFVGIGNILGYLAGYMDLPAVLWFFGDTQFKDLCAIASIALVVTVALSCIFIRERDPRLEGPPPKDKPGPLAFFRTIFASIRRLPPQTRKVCEVQFCAWIGFFPMLFYTSAYVGEIYAEPFLRENPNMTDQELDKLYEDATRQGTFALLMFAIMGLATNVFLPFFIEPTYDAIPSAAAEDSPASVKAYDDEKKSWLDYLVIPGFTLRRAWMLAQLLFTGCMLCTVLVRTVTAATVLIGLVGITWALTLWAPWAIISAEISRRDELRRARNAQRNLSPGDRAVASLDGYSSDENSSSRRLGSASGEEDDGDQAGVILGIHNMAIAAPQIIATVLSSIIFKLFQKPRGVPGDHSIAIVLALGGLTVFASVFFIYRIRDEPGGASAGAYDAVRSVEDGDAASDSRPGTAHSRRRSHETLSRVSLDRASMVRNRSFGGAEYD